MKGYRNQSCIDSEQNTSVPEGCILRTAGKPFLLSVVIIISELYGANGKVMGRVTDSLTGEPLPAVNIVINGTDLGAATDNQGFYFVLNLPPRSYDIRAGMIGYSALTKTGVIVNANHTTTLDFVLSPTVLEGASVSFYDNDNNLVAVNTTDSLGHIDTLDLVEYVETVDGKAYRAPYTVVVEQGGVELYTGSYAIDGNTTVTMTQVAVTGNESYHPAAFRLDQNYPNPFNPVTVISYEVEELTATSLRIYDIRGRLVRTLFTAYKIPGRYERTWDGTDEAGIPVSSGIYIYSLSGGGEVINRRMVLLR